MREPQAAVQFRGRVYSGDYHQDCLEDCIQDPRHPESHADLQAIIDDEQEPIEFGHVIAGKGFVPLTYGDSNARKEWYLKPTANIWRNLFGRK